MEDNQLFGCIYAMYATCVMAYMRHCLYPVRRIYAITYVLTTNREVTLRQKDTSYMRYMHVIHISYILLSI
jgi:hypothetical protein